MGDIWRVGVKSVNSPLFDFFGHLWHNGEAMNIHPALVHFPIALLMLYAIFELISFGKLKRFTSWFYIKLTLLMSGFLFALPTLNTGETAAELIGRDSSLWPIIMKHNNWASISVFLFGILTLIYLLVWIRDYPECDRVYKRLKANKYTAWPWSMLSRLAGMLYNSPLVWILALGGLVAIAITGALGGSLVHGPNADPFVKFVLNLLRL